MQLQKNIWHYKNCVMLWINLNNWKDYKLDLGRKLKKMWGGKQTCEGQQRTTTNQRDVCKNYFWSNIQTGLI